MKFDKSLTYQNFSFRGYDIGAVTAKKVFVFITVDGLRAQFNILKEDPTLYDYFRNLKSKTYLSNYSKNFYRSFKKSQDVFCFL
jgi:hypothetical protein